jgi:stress-induced morphogen
MTIELKAAPMSRKDQITQMLMQAFTPTRLEVTDESHKHAGHPGVRGSTGETHFHIRMRSPAFDGLSLVERHRRVNGCLKDLFNEGLHALSLDLKGSES